MRKFNYELLEKYEKKIMNEFARRLGVTPMQIIEKNRASHITDIRHIYCKLRHDMHGLKYTAVASEIDRTPKAVKKGVIRIDDMLYVKDIKVVTMWNRVKCIPCTISQLTLLLASPTFVANADVYREAEFIHLYESVFG